MSANRKGGLKAKAKNLAKDPLYYQKIGALGGVKSRGGGFSDRALARRAGSKGGTISRRGKDKRPRKTHTFDELFNMPEPFAEGFGRSTWYDKLSRLWRRNG